MEIDEIRELLANEIAYNNAWAEKLSDTDPGIYGVEDWDVSISKENIWVDIPSKTYTFKNVNFSFDVQLGSSNADDGVKMSFTKIGKGQGTFTFTSTSKKIEIKEINIEFDVVLFND
jgi:hypothetical protein